MGRNRLCQCEPPSDVVDAELAKPEDDRKVRKDPTGVWRWKQCGRCGSLRKKRWRETRHRAFAERDEYVTRVLANMMRDDDEEEEEDGEAEDADADGTDGGVARGCELLRAGAGCSARLRGFALGCGPPRAVARCCARL